MFKDSVETISKLNMININKDYIFRLYLKTITKDYI